MNNFYYINDIAKSRSFSLSTYVLFISVIQLVCGVQHLNIACLLFLFICLAATATPASTTVMVPLANMYTSL